MKLKTLPTNAKQWATEMSSYKLKENRGLAASVTEEGVQMLGSGSRITDQQYLLLRVIWKPSMVAHSDPAKFMKDSIESEFGNMTLKESRPHDLDTSAESQLSPIANRSYKLFHCGLFTLVDWQQLLIQEIKADDPTEVVSTAMGMTPRRLRPRKLVDNIRRPPDAAFTPPSQKKPAMPDQVRAEGESDDHLSLDEDDLDPGNLRSAADEQIVNTALVLLLDALLLSIHGHKLEVTLERKKFTFDLPVEDFEQSSSGTLTNISSSSEDKSKETANKVSTTQSRPKPNKRFFFKWSAATDGYMRFLSEPEKICSILEVKSYERRRFSTRVRKQEAAEVACWIHHDKEDWGAYCNHDKRGGDRWRLLISQDRASIWIIIATYSESYQNYIRYGKDPGNAGLMSMNEIGPYHVNDYEHMGLFREFIRAFSAFATRQRLPSERLHVAPVPELVSESKQQEQAPEDSMKPGGSQPAPRKKGEAANIVTPEKNPYLLRDRKPFPPTPSPHGLESENLENSDTDTNEDVPRHLRFQ
ncbi:Hypothetical protein R9X50_00464300 [Acrodontium crateriforme]|uniref:Uncharacterized protein n=1 Tax=Acrodontium crateriforme TaxID=150365 RepID=A0AAQ3M6K1_9PEZI|nr:Hypothetical protein R9X50_00464300 [Acrodontium crateriforme]